MISIQSAMLVALGFLAASLLALFVAPAFWSRAVRLTTLRIKNTMPLSEIEIRADKDRVRAEFAVKVHHLDKHEPAVHDLLIACAGDTKDMQLRTELERLAT